MSGGGKETVLLMVFGVKDHINIKTRFILWEKQLLLYKFS